MTTSVLGNESRKTSVILSPNKPENWILELRRGLDYRMRYGGEKRWKEHEALFYNTHDSAIHEGPNLIYSIGDSVLSGLTQPYPYIEVEPLRPQFAPGAMTLQGVDNALLGEMRLQEEVEQMVLHAYLWGTGFLKIGYDSEWGWSSENEEALSSGFSLSQFSQQGRRLEYNQAVTPGMPWVRAVLPMDIVMPWGTQRLSEAEWIAHRVIRHVEDVRKDQKYSKTRYLKPNMSMEDISLSYSNKVSTHRRITGSTSRESRSVEWVEMWEIHDRRTQRVYVVVPGHEQMIRNDEDLMQVNGLPFVDLSFTPRSRSVWTTSDAEYLFQAQNELSDIAVQRTKMRRLNVVKLLAQGEAFEESELNRLLSADVGAFAKVSGSVDDIRKAVLPINANPAGGTALNQEAEAVRRDARELLGNSRNQLGEFEGGRRTAEEVATVRQAVDQRFKRRDTQIRRVYKDVFSKINPILFEHWKQPQVAKVLGPDGFEQWTRFTGDQLRGRYSYTVALIDPEERARKTQFGLAMFAQLAAHPMVNPIELKNFLVSEVGDPRFARIFNSQPNAPVEGVTQGGSNGVAQGQNPGAGDRPTTQVGV